ncbi:MAG: hypothetical protein KIS73_00150 [Enhydrobacter sp.]|nr:hypothetical protein [Enhydrobacter sp.]
MFQGYRFEHPRKEMVVEVGGWSYLWAGLFGAFYVWRMGFGRLFAKAMAINLGYLTFFIGVWAATSYAVPLRIQAAILLAMIPILIISQGVTMIRMIRDGYRHRGWMVRQG